MEAFRHVGLVLEHVERGPGDLAVLDGVEQAFSSTREPRATFTSTPFGPRASSTGRDEMARLS